MESGLTSLLAARGNGNPSLERVVGVDGGAGKVWSVDEAFVVGDWEEFTSRKGTQQISEDQLAKQSFQSPSRWLHVGTHTRGAATSRAFSGVCHRKPSSPPTVTFFLAVTLWCCNQCRSPSPSGLASGSLSRQSSRWPSCPSVMSRGVASVSPGSEPGTGPYLQDS